MNRAFWRRGAALCLALCLTAGLVGCAKPQQAQSSGVIPPKPESAAQSDETPTASPAPTDLTDPSYLAMTEYLNQNGFVCAAAMIGYTSDPKWDGSYQALYGDQGHLADYPFIAGIPDERFIEQDGNMLFCIVPADPNSSVAVNQWIIPEGSGQQGYAGEVLYRSESGEPILLRGNADENTSNLQVSITDESGRTATFFPLLNPMDGALILAELSEAVWDFTLDSDPMYGEPPNTIGSVTLDKLLGDWTAVDVLDAAGRSLTCSLAFCRDDNSGQKMEFLCCDQEGNLIKRFEGAYCHPDDIEAEPLPERMRFELTLTEGEGADTSGIPEQIIGVFSILATYEADVIVVAHRQGDPLLSGMGTGWIEFHRAQG